MVNHTLLMVTPKQTHKIELGAMPGMQAEEEIEKLRKEGWIKVLYEYIPAVSTRIYILSKEEEE